MKQAQKFYLGVEGGASKSTAILSDGQKILDQRSGKSLSYHNIGEKEAKKNLQSLTALLLKKNRKGELSAVFGFAGLDAPQDKTVYQRIVRSVMPKGARSDAVNDANIAIEAKCPGEQNRVLVISGTGASILGQSGDKEAKTTGWDFLLGDEGSGYEIGLKVLKSAMQSYDGRMEKTLLEKLLLQQTKCKSMKEFVPKLYQMIRRDPEELKRTVASFAPLLDSAIIKNDWRAKQIRQETIQALMQGVRAIVKKLGMEQKQFCMGFVGSIWKMPDFQEQFKKEMKQQFPRATFSNKEDSGAWGAVLLAKKLN